MMAAVFTVGPAFAEKSMPEKSLYVQSARAKLLASPNFKAAVVVSVEKGNSVKVMEQSGTWYKVKFNEQIGWVSRLVLSENPPIEKKSVLTGDVDEMKKNARRRASNSTTAAATRGLQRDDLFNDDGEGKSDFEALKKMESLQIKESDIWNFNQELQEE